MGVIKGQQTWTLKQLVQRLATVQEQVKDEWKSSPLAASKQKIDEIGHSDRDRTVKWLLQLALRFQFYPDTFFLSVNLLDRFITSVKAHPKYLRCIAITCLYLASKIVEEEEIIPRTKDLVEASGCGCRTGDVLRMERIILDKLQWDLCATTSLEYLHVYHAVASGLMQSYDPDYARRNLQKLTHALVRIVSHYPIFTSYPNAVLALAVFSVDLEESRNTQWFLLTTRMKELTNLDTDLVMNCRQAVRRYVLSTRPMSTNSAFVLNVPQQQQQQRACAMTDTAKESLSGKRKMGDDDSDDSTGKKLHTTTYNHHHHYRYRYHNDGNESDATLTASEGEEEEDEDDENAEHVLMDDDDVDDGGQDRTGNRDCPSSMRPMTYAEIVKSRAPSCVRAGAGPPTYSPNPPPLVYHEDCCDIAMKEEVVVTSNDYDEDGGEYDDDDEADCCERQTCGQQSTSSSSSSPPSSSSASSNARRIIAMTTA